MKKILFTLILSTLTVGVWGNGNLLQPEREDDETECYLVERVNFFHSEGDRLYETATCSDKDKKSLRLAVEFYQLEREFFKTLQTHRIFAYLKEQFEQEYSYDYYEDEWKTFPGNTIHKK